MKNLVSVIIPVKNRIDFLEAALSSVFNQGYRPIEIIVVDDGSTPDGKAALEQIINKFKCHHTNDISIAVIYTPSKGAPHARNIGVGNSKGDFIQFLDSDDVLLPDKINEQIAVLNNTPHIDLVYSKAQYVDEKMNRLEKYWGRRLDGSSMDYFLFSWQTMCALYRKDTILKYGLWDESLKINQDWELSIRYIICGANTYFIDKIHCLFRTHSKGNIGSFKGNLEKVLSKWSSTQKIYLLLKEKEKLDTALRRAFLKRWIYILLLTSGLNAKREFNDQLDQIKREVPPLYYRVMKLFGIAWISKTALRFLGYKPV